MKKSTWFIIAILAVSGGFVGSLLQNSLFSSKGSTTLKVASDREDLLKTVNTGGEDLTKFETASAVSTPTVVFFKPFSRYVMKALSGSGILTHLEVEEKLPVLEVESS